MESRVNASDNPNAPSAGPGEGDAQRLVASSERDDYLSWGRTERAHHSVKKLHWIDEAPAAMPGNGKLALPYGLGRSYGDVCLNGGGLLLDTTGLDRFYGFDPETGIVTCEAGVTVADLLREFLPRGWFPPVTPGTKYVTLGGAVANDVHGKNHHQEGSFGSHVLGFELVRSDRRRLWCSPTENQDLFRATVGGMGLTGLITYVRLQMKPVVSDRVVEEILPFGCIEEFFEICHDCDENYEYTVAWIDCMATGRKLGRGLLMQGNHAAGPVQLPSRATAVREPFFTVPVNAPRFLLNRHTMKMFNGLHYYRHHRPERVTTHYEPFFYPLDAIKNWNRLYGKQGFYQYQFVLPHEREWELRTILERIAWSGLGSFLAVLKRFGDRESPGMMSFPMPGVTLALDFPERGRKTQRLFTDLDRMVTRLGGRVYPAKDAVMSREVFQSGFSAWKEFSRYVDPGFSSNFWRRVH